MSNREDFEKWLPHPWIHCYEWDTVFGVKRSLEISPSTYNGSQCDRAVPLFTKAQMEEAFLAGRQPPEGWKLVPTKVTAEMIDAGVSVGVPSYTGTWQVDVARCYCAMLAAAPERG